MDKSDRHKRIAICYDFDLTLSPQNMQEHTIIPSFGMEKDEFWKEVGEYTRQNEMDQNLAWMYKLIEKSDIFKQHKSKEYFEECGKHIKFFPGVEMWFDNINKYAQEKGVEIEHYIISSGLKEIIKGTSIADKFSRVYASSYVYSADGVALWPAIAVNYTTKTQFIFRIAKGKFDVFDESVNEPMNEEKLHIKYSNIIYIGDSDTDIPCMRLVKEKGGLSIGVYNENKKDKVLKLIFENRINAFAPADYTEGKKLEKLVKAKINAVSDEVEILEDVDKMKSESKMYRMEKILEELESLDNNIFTKVRNKFLRQTIRKLVKANNM